MYVCMYVLHMLASGVQRQNRCEFLSSFIDDYVDHIALYPNSCLPRFLGSYAIHIYNSVFYFLVSNNIFHTAQVRTNCIRCC